MRFFAPSGPVWVRRPMLTVDEIGRQILKDAHLSTQLHDTCLEALSKPGRLFSTLPVWSRLFLSWVEALAPPPHATFLPASAAYEYMVAGYDLLDDVYDQETRELGDSAQSPALAASHTLLMLTQEVIARLEVPAERRASTCANLGRAGRRAIAAQQQDYALRQDSSSESDTVLLKTLERRSGTLVAAPCQGAALLAGASWRLVALAGRFGRALGCAAQLEDDLADRTEDERGGRRTIPTRLARSYPDSVDLVEATTRVLIHRYFLDAARALERLPAPYDAKDRTEALWKLLPPDLKTA